MKYINATLIVFLTFIALSMFAFAQHGSAPSGYYPMGYNGDTFKGTILSSDKDAGTLTLESSNKKKPEKFTAAWEGPCSMPVKGKSVPFILSDVPLGTEIIVYYTEVNYKEGGEKKTKNVIIGIMPIAENGKVILEDKRSFMPCKTGK